MLVCEIQPSFEAVTEFEGVSIDGNPTCFNEIQPDGGVVIETVSDATHVGDNETQSILITLSPLPKMKYSSRPKVSTAIGRTAIFSSSPFKRSLEDKN